jgi:hypothetical protein
VDHSTVPASGKNVSLDPRIGSNQLVSLDPETGALVYATYSNEVNAQYDSIANPASLNTVPDFSHAGFRGGGKSSPYYSSSFCFVFQNDSQERNDYILVGVEIPFVKTKVIVSPSEEDAAIVIQDAIDQVSDMPLDAATGFRGAVLIQAGTYEVSQPLFINADGVVIRGQGCGSTGGTTIVYTSTERESDTFTFGSAEGGTDTVGDSVVDIVDDFVPVGSKYLTVSRTDAFSVGDRIVIEFTPNMDWIDQMSGMGQYGW